jgi:hypothetical protein
MVYGNLQQYRWVLYFTISKNIRYTKNTVQVHVDPILIGNPSSFNYITSVMVSVNSTFLNKPPDYIMDSAPDNDRFWREWFTQ